MSEKIQREELSAWMDNESSVRPAEVGALLASARMKECWGRYHLIGDCLRGRLVGGMLTVSSEPQPSPEGPHPPLPVTGSPAGLSPMILGTMAASFAAVLGVLLLIPLDPPTRDPEAHWSVTGGLLPEDLLPVEFLGGPQVPGQANPAVAEVQRLSGYLISHSEHLAHMGSQGMLPYARLAADPPEHAE